MSNRSWHAFYLPDEQCRELAGRIAASQEFHRAAKQREFLVYVVDRKLSGCPEDVTEALIGHRVYGRPASYDAGNDSIVRTEARTLRNATSANSTARESTSAW